mgnify:FL=1
MVRSVAELVTNPADCVDDTLIVELCRAWIETDSADLVHGFGETLRQGIENRALAIRKLAFPKLPKPPDR